MCAACGGEAEPTPQPIPESICIKGALGCPALDGGWRVTLDGGAD